MGSHRTDSTGLRLVSTAQLGGGRFHILNGDDILCGRKTDENSIVHEGEWADRLLDRCTSTTICANCRRKVATVISR